MRPKEIPGPFLRSVIDGAHRTGNARTRLNNEAKITDGLLSFEVVSIDIKNLTAVLKTVFIWDTCSADEYYLHKIKLNPDKVHITGETISRELKTTLIYV